MESVVKFYTSHCARCLTLKTLLAKKGIEYVEVTDMDEAKSFGLASAPGLGVMIEEQRDTGIEYVYKVLDFNAAIKWINSRGK